MSKTIIPNLTISSLENKSIEDHRFDFIRLSNGIPVCAEANRFKVGQKIVTFLNDSIINIDLANLINPLKDVIQPYSNEYTADNWFRFNQKPYHDCPNCAIILEIELFNETIHKVCKFCKKVGFTPEKPLDSNKFPVHLISKTDEPSYFNSPSIYDMIVLTNQLIVTRKYDGTSLTIIKETNGETIFCSRKFKLENIEPPYSMFINSNQEIFVKIEPETCIQGELVGPEISQNKLNLKSYKYFVFNIKQNDKYLNYDEMSAQCLKYGFDIVEEIERWVGNLPSVDQLEKIAHNIKNDEGQWSEGIVIRSLLNSRLSFKIINENYKDN